MMSDGRSMEDAVSATDNASQEIHPARVMGLSDTADHAASNGAFAGSSNAVVSPVRSMNMSNLLRSDPDEFVAGSDQDGDQASPTTAASSLVAVPVQLVHSAVAAHRTDGLGQDDAAAGLLMRLAISASHDDFVATAEATDAVAMEEEVEATSSGVVDVEMAVMEAADATEEATDDAATAAAGTDAVEAAVDAAEPRRDKRGRLLPTRKPAKKTKAKVKAVMKKMPSLAAVDAPSSAVDAPETMLSQTETPPQPAATRTREKRRIPPPPAPVRSAPSKKPKTSAKASAAAAPTDAPTGSGRPKRVAAKAVTSYAEPVDVDEEQEDEQAEDDEEEDVPMVIARENVEASRVAVAAAAAAAASSTLGRASSASEKKILKRKTMSKRQYDELLSGEVVGESIDADADADDGGVLAPAAAVVLAAPVLAAPAAKLRPCEFCHLDHSAFAMFYCHSCRRVYHGKCLMDAFRPAVKDGVAIADQMEQLILYRPEGRSSVLRCVSCQAAFLDLFKRPETHRDCTCATCLKTPQKTADYRRVSLKMIVDEHNALLRSGKKGGKAPKKTGAAPAPAKTTKARASARKEEAAVPVEEEVSAEPVKETAQNGRDRGARAGRRNRDSDQADIVLERSLKDGSDGTAQETTVVHVQDAKPVARKATIVVAVKPKGKFTKSNRRARGKGAQQSDVDDAMEVDASSNGHRGETTEAMDVENISTSTQQLYGPGRERGDRDTKVDEHADVVASKKVTISNLEQLIQITKDDSNDSWSFRVACSPSGKTTESGMYKEATFVWHPKNSMTLECACCTRQGMTLRSFVQHTDPSLLPRDGEDPYQYMFAVLKDGEVVPLGPVLAVVRALWGKTKRRLSAGSVGDGESKPPDERDEKRNQAVALLSGVAFKPVVRDRKRRSPDTVQSEFVCEVICAEERYLPTIASDDKVLSNRLPGVSADVWRRGQLEVRENRLSKIRCECCNQPFSTKTFREHLQKTLENTRNQQLQEEKQEPRHVGSPRDSVSSTASNTPVNHAVRVALGVSQGPLTLLKMDSFILALQQVGSQAEINKAIAGILQSQGGSNP